jgi:hypothetical protein
VGNLLRWKYDNQNQKFDPYGEEIPRQPEMVTNGDFPEKMSKSEGSNDARGWPTVDLEQAKTTYVENNNDSPRIKMLRNKSFSRIEEKENVKDFDIQEWIKKSDDLEVPRKDGESDDAWNQRKKEAEKKGHKANIEAIREAKTNMLQCGR